MGFQRGRALTTAGIATLATNAIPIAAAMTLFAEPLPAGPLGVVRVLSFAAVVAGAAALAPERAARNPARSETPIELGRAGGLVDLLEHEREPSQRDRGEKQPEVA
jgi:hypothetical protein